MSKNLTYSMSPIMKLRMLNKEKKIVGIVNNRVQVLITLPNLRDFSDELKNTISIFSKKTECFIITSSEIEAVDEVSSKYELSKSFISLDFKNFNQVFNQSDDLSKFQKSLIIIDKNCQIRHKDIL